MSTFIPIILANDPEGRHSNSASDPEGRHSREGGNPYTRDLEEKLRHSMFAFLKVLWNMDSGSPLRYGRNDGLRGSFAGLE